MSSGEGEGLAIGIDLGTTYSCVGVWRKDRVEIIPNDQGNRITPSYVAFKGDERLVGDGAKNLAASNPTNTIFDAKRLIGRRFTDSTVENDMALWPFKVTAGEDDKPMIIVQFKGEEKRFTAEEISAMVLSKMKETAETFLGRDVHNAVVTVPAYFNDSQRRCTKDAGTIAGLNVMRIINEPTAAALAYGLEQTNNGPKRKMTVLIFDLGGGTFDVSLLEIENGNIDVKATAGDTHLGGEDFDSRMVSHLADEFARKHRKELRDNPRALRRLRTACERAKRNLSFTTVVPVEVDCLYEGVDFNTTFTRAKFEDLNADLFAKCISVLEQCLNDAKMDKTQIDEAVLVGGSTRIPRVQQMLKDFLNGKALCSNLHADEAVAHGASILAAMLGGTQSRLAKQLVLSDVTPISIGLRNSDGVMVVFIPKNTPIPVEKEQRKWTTVSDYQTDIPFNVFEGERAMASDNNLIGSFYLRGITPQPAYVPNFRVVFHLDVDGILSVSAEDMASGVRASVTITNDGGRLTKDEIDRMASDALRYKQEDEQRRRKADARSEVERFAYVTRNTIRSPIGTSKLQTVEKDVIERACAEALAWSECNAATADEYDYRYKKVELEQLWNGIKYKLHP